MDRFTFLEYADPEYAKYIEWLGQVRGEADRENDCDTGSVFDLSCSAACNAVDTLNEIGNKTWRDEGEFLNDEFLRQWYGSLLGLLVGGECKESTREWYAKRGIIG